MHFSKLYFLSTARFQRTRQAQWHFFTSLNSSPHSVTEQAMLEKFPQFKE